MTGDFNREVEEMLQEERDAERIFQGGETSGHKQCDYCHKFRPSVSPNQWNRPVCSDCMETWRSRNPRPCSACTKPTDLTYPLRDGHTLPLCGECTVRQADQDGSLPF